MRGVWWGWRWEVVVSVQGVCVQGVCVQEASLSRGVSILGGSLSRGVCVQECLCQGDTAIRLCACGTHPTGMHSCFNYFSKFNFSFERIFSKNSKSKTHLYKCNSALDIRAQNIKNEGSYVSDQLLDSKSLDVHRYRSQSLNISNQNPLIESLKGSTGVKIASISAEKLPLPATVRIWQCGHFGVGTFHLF